MNKKKKIRVLILELILFVIAVIAIIFWINNEKKEIAVYDFARTIQYDEKENYALTEADIEEVFIMQADVKPEYITNKEEALGMYITGTAYKGSHIMKNQLSKDPTAIAIDGVSELANYRKIYLPVSFATAFAGDIKAGDRVDLMFQENGSGLPIGDVSSLGGAQSGLSYNSSRIFMQNIPIFQVYQANGAVYTRRETDPMTLNRFSGELSTDGTTENVETGAPAYVALTVTVDQYEEIATRLNSGVVSIVCRFDESQDVESQGYLTIKGSGANIYTGKGNLEYEHNLLREKEETPDTQINVTRPALYTFIRDLSKVDMTDEQRERWNALYTRYSDLMKYTQGDNWEVSNPELISIDDINVGIGDNIDYLRLSNAFKTDLEAFAKELRGENVLLPW